VKSRPNLKEPKDDPCIRHLLNLNLRRFGDDSHEGFDPDAMLFVRALEKPLSAQGL
jgi:hypothetical protein